MKPIKKVKGCPGCKFFNGHTCSKTTTVIPIPIFNGIKKCSIRKKNKHIYF